MPRIFGGALILIEKAQKRFFKMEMRNVIINKPKKRLQSKTKQPEQ
jgi:hypothetical protein